MNIDYVLKPCFDAFQEIGDQIKDERQYILRKLISNLEAINVLLKNNCTHEIEMILRSAIESVVLFAYLTSFPTKIPEYILSSELLEFKCTFILYKNYKKEFASGRCSQKDLDDLCDKVKNKFEKKLSEHCQKYVLEKLDVRSLAIEQNYENLDKFFHSDKLVKEPFFMKIEQMFREIPYVYSEFSLRDLLYYDYNNCSQVLHSQYVKWAKDIIITEDFVKDLEGIIHGIITLPLVYAKKNNINISEQNACNLKVVLETLNK